MDSLEIMQASMKRLLAHDQTNVCQEYLIAQAQHCRVSLLTQIISLLIPELASLYDFQPGDLSIAAVSNLILITLFFLLPRSTQRETMNSVFESLANALYDLVNSQDPEDEVEEDHQDLAVQMPKSVTEGFDEIESEFKQLQTTVERLRPSYAKVSRKLDVSIEELYHLLCLSAVTHGVWKLVRIGKSSRLCSCQ